MIISSIAAIIVTQEELARCKKLNSAPVLEEFIQKICTDDKDDKAEDSEGKDVSSRDKKNWMRSAQLCLSTDADSNKTKVNWRWKFHFWIQDVLIWFSVYDY